MPTIQPGKDTKVLVSGANGFVAIWLVRTLLEEGYFVRGTVRSAAKGKHLEKLFGDYGDRLDLVIVDDITKVLALTPEFAKFVFTFCWNREARLTKL